MKIAYLLPRLDNKSSITLFKDLIPKLKQLNSNIEIDIYFFDNEVSLHFPHKTHKIDFFSGSIALNNYDIVHSSGIRPNVYVWLNKWRFGSNSRFVTTIHSFIYEDFKNQFSSFLAFLYTKMWLSLLNSQHAVVVLTEVAKTYYLDKIKSRIEVVNNGKGPLQNDLMSEEDVKLMEAFVSKFSYVIGTHAVVSKIKGLDTVVKGLVTLKDYCFVIVGDGPEVESLKRLAQELNVQNRILFIGFRKNIGSFFRFYDMYVMPSRSEGLPLALIEAVSSRTFCLTSDIPTFIELFEDDEVPKFKLDDVDDFCKQILKYKDKFLIQERIEKAYIKYTNRYTDEVMARNYYNLYLELCKTVNSA
ncbi:glycosyltransferase family 4 protein [Pedobacter sp. UBA4863]|uniref:glycosyltransferase family 4 protein n=1 Tax=Pedobacter sp. UBA4863 TaxID=1947060 RepID=UPI0025F255C1|nr:glycosyltransferase family 4 protein [Pedobacter sp. UBA4863]